MGRLKHTANKAVGGKKPSKKPRWVPAKRKTPNQNLRALRSQCGVPGLKSCRQASVHRERALPVDSFRDARLAIFGWCSRRWHGGPVRVLACVFSVGSIEATYMARCPRVFFSKDARRIFCTNILERGQDISGDSQARCVVPSQRRADRDGRAIRVALPYAPVLAQNPRHTFHFRSLLWNDLLYT